MKRIQPFVERKPPDKCPVCGHTGRCKRHLEHGNDLVLCFRVAEWRANGYRRLRRKGECSTYVHVGSPADRDSAAKETRPNRSTPCTEVTDLNARMRRHQAEATDVRVSELAESLGVGTASLRAIGVGFNPLPCFPEYDASGNVTAINVRHPDGSKKVGRGERRGLIVPCNLAELPDPVYAVEGPTDVAAALTMGLTAVGRPNSTGGAELLAMLLRGRNCIVFGEHDKKPNGKWPGKDGAESVAKALSEFWGVEVSWVFPPEGAKDVREYLSRYDDPADAGAKLQAHVRSQQPGLAIVCASDVTPEPVEWLWRNRIPTGKLTLFTGDPDVGKSFLTMDLASRVSTGTPFPDSRDVANPPGDVLIFSVEDGVRDTIVPRLTAAGAELKRIRIVEGVKRPQLPEEPTMFDLQRDLRHLQAELEAVPKTRLVIIDPVGAYMGIRRDTYRDNEVRGVLAPLAALAERRRIAVVCVLHLNKQLSVTRAMYRALASIGFTAAARASHLVTFDPDDEQRRNRLFLRVKCNLAPDPGGLRFHLDGDPGAVPCVHWHDGTVELTADEALDAATRNDGRRVDEAKEWLTKTLAGGPMRQPEVEAMAKQDGITKRTLVRAKRKLGVMSVQRPIPPIAPDSKPTMGWWWEAPAERLQDAD